MRPETRASIESRGVAFAALVASALGCGGRTGLDLSTDGASSASESFDGGSPGAPSSGATSEGSAGSRDASPSSLPPSCAPGGPGLTDCGANRESCCTSLEVAGDPATVSSFRLDKYEVTVGRFRQFVNAWDGGRGWLPAAASGKHTHLHGGHGLASTHGGAFETGWLESDDASVAPTSANLACYPLYATWTPPAGSNERLPINCASWYEAYAFCIWDGGFLPTEAEWRYAAAGGGEHREYPWGSSDPGPDSQRAIHGDETGTCYYPAMGTCTGTVNIAPVGTATLGGGLWGQLDLAGNVWEWNLDGDSYDDVPCADRVNFTETEVVLNSRRMARGGNFEDTGGDLSSSASRLVSPQTERQIDLGFRCARQPSGAKP